ncbi:sensor histidine kinase [Mucilaginibacter ginkgonis]|uniref:Histidine kinase n=1 Tax=Mucilaginibacter ginkgonis TaxID=2682091 RepID=A0A6I4INV6_9SPHI|nr:histidine kinase [Mucilaginibacter ginkgonis]QQL48904.1 histidine kinase [Mucilaginibacter ginkgonis]
MNYYQYHRNPVFGKPRYHFTFWAVFIIYEVAVSYSYSGGFAPVVDYVTAYTLNISLFYIHSNLFCRVLTEKAKPIPFIIGLVLIEIMVYLGVKYLLGEAYKISGIENDKSLDNIEGFIRNGTWRAFYFIGLSSAFGFSMVAESLRRKTADLELNALMNEKERLHNELTLLKSQIDPHFLFNSLGLVHNKVAKYSREAGEVVLLLSDMMRYALETPGYDNKVALGDEIQHVRNYIKLNQHRLDKPVYVNFDINGKIDGDRIPPLILLTLVENAFKYGETTDSRQPVRIVLESNSEEIIFKISNHKKLNNSGTGIGQDNMVKRLGKTYGDRFSFKVYDIDNIYAATLTIQKDELLYN